MDSLKRRAVARLVASAYLVCCGLQAQAQTPSLEYRVKAAYLYNFAKYVEWPEAAPGASLAICVAGRNPFGPVLDETVRGETIADREVTVRVILEPEEGCDVLFIPQGSSTTPYLRAARGAPILTVGETRDFIAQGGMISFVLEGPNVRFEIDPEAAARAGIRISSRLMQVARAPSRERRP